MSESCIASLVAGFKRRGHFTLGPIDLDLHAGQWTTLRGSSGAGKTTLLQLLGGLDRLDSGSLMLLGHDVTRASEGQLSALRQRGIAWISQDSDLIESLPVWQNVTLRLIPLGMATRERRHRAMTVLEPLGLGDFADRRPNALSGGERQRVAVARALVAEPRLILADEPTASIDAETGAFVLEKLAERREAGAALLVSSHDPEALRFADHSWVMRAGQRTNGGTTP